jgi:membrane protease subunit (stomatin/prohibitin family)
MPRMLRRAVVLGTTAHVASKAGAARAQQQQAPQEAPPEQPAAAQQAAPAKEDPFEALTKFKDLLDKGILTQEEFDAEKQKILNAT